MKIFGENKKSLGGGNWGEDRAEMGGPTEGNWYPVVVEVVDLVSGSSPERVQYANLGIGGCPWWGIL